MRSYEKQSENKLENKLEKVICNRCGREMKVVGGILQEGVFEASVLWGYFSDRDGERHSFALCEACYEKIIHTFQIPVQIEEQTELI